jgi:hypothetical protein
MEKFRWRDSLLPPVKFFFKKNFWSHVRLIKQSDNRCQHVCTKGNWMSIFSIVFGYWQVRQSAQICSNWLARRHVYWRTCTTTLHQISRVGLFHRRSCRAAPMYVLPPLCTAPSCTLYLQKTATNYLIVYRLKSTISNKFYRMFSLLHFFRLEFYDSLAVCVRSRAEAGKAVLQLYTRKHYCFA